MQPRTASFAYEPGASTASARAVCSYCGVGCGIVVSPSDGSVASVAGDKEHPANHGRLCTKGATHVELMAAPGRMATAFVRPTRGEEAIPAPLESGIAEAGARLRSIIDAHGPDAVAMYVSGQMSLEAQYVANKLMKGFVRSKHIESNSRLCMASAGTGYKQSLGADGPPGSYEDLDLADLFFVIGSNMADCHPILFLRMADRLKAGARLIVVDPRRTATAERADLYLQIRPGTDLALLNGLLHLLVAGGAIDADFVAAYTEGWEAMPEFLADYSPSRVADTTGLDEDDIRLAARWIAEAGEWMTLWTMGLNQSTQGTWHTNAICNLHLATGAICRPGSGPFSLTGQPNAMGGREMGYMGPGLPGQRSIANADDRRFVEAAWDLEPGSIRSETGSGTIDLYRAMARGEIRAAWIVCTNPVASVANRSTVVEALERAELVISQDVFTATATNAYADILLPATLWVESEGVSVSSDRTMTLVPRVADAPGDARPDWWLICAVARAMGFEHGFDFDTSEEILDEIRRFWNPATGWDVRGVTYDRLRRGPVQWPAPPDDPADRHPTRYFNDGVSQELHRNADGTVPRLAFATASRRAQFFARPHLGPADLPDDEFPFVLNTGRLQHQWHTMTKTGRVDKLNRLNPDPFVELHPDDAAAQGIADGDLVALASRRGRAVLPAVVTERVRPGGVFAPFHWNDLHGDDLTINALTSDAVDAASLQPEFKFTAVSLTRVAAAPAPEHSAPAAAGAGEGFAALLTAPAVMESFCGDASERTWVTGFVSALTSSDVAPALLPAVPPEAPLGSAARAWLLGLLAGAAAARASAAPRTDAGASDGEVVVLWGSQTGTAEDVAHGLTSALTTRGVAARAVSMTEVTPAALAEAGTALVVTSTFGDGGPPDNAAALWNRLQASPAVDLTALRFAVFALGDSNYGDFCGHGRRLDHRLAELGAERLSPRWETEPNAAAADAARWLDELAPALGAVPAASVSPASDVVAPAARRLFTRGNPLRVAKVVNERLSGAGSSKDVRRIGFDLSHTGVAWEAGDALGVVCANRRELVDEWLDATGASPHAVVEVDDAEVRLRDALSASLDITRIGSELVRFVAERSGSSELRTLLQRENSARLAQFLWRMQAVDLLRAFPVSATPAEWAGLLPRLQPRQYSISSSPKVDPSTLEITMSMVRFDTEDGRRRAGVCSSYLGDEPSGDDVPVFLQRAPQFRPPTDPDTPMIMIGPGTGVAPFRSFLQDRRADGHRGRNWLFFGDQHESSDFLYRDELEAWHADRFLERLDLAFSRDQRQKIYVQDRMIEHGAQLWRWLQDGAHLYVCGDASRMAPDVDAALSVVAQRHGGLSQEAAAEYRAEMIADRRYARDIY